MPCPFPDSESGKDPGTDYGCKRFPGARSREPKVTYAWKIPLDYGAGLEDEPLRAINVVAPVPPVKRMEVLAVDWLPWYYVPPRIEITDRPDAQQRKDADMKLYLDTANVKEIQEGAELGLIDGVTTNPSLVAKEGRSFKDMLLEICNIVDGPISAEVVGVESDAMIKEGRDLAKIHKNIVVKVPLIPEGLRATRKLSAEGIRVNVTLCFSPTQAILAAKAGAWCVSPFIGRLDDISSDGMELIRQIVAIYDNYDYKTQVLVASVRSPQHVVDAALAGGHICTMPSSVFKMLIKHPLTDLGLKKFLADWEAMGKK